MNIIQSGKGDRITVGRLRFTYRIRPYGLSFHQEGRRLCIREDGWAGAWSTTMLAPAAAAIWFVLYPGLMIAEETTSWPDHGWVGVLTAILPALLLLPIIYVKRRFRTAAFDLDRSEVTYTHRGLWRMRRLRYRLDQVAIREHPAVFDYLGHWPMKARAVVLWMPDRHLCLWMAPPTEGGRYMPSVPEELQRLCKTEGAEIHVRGVIA